MSQVLALGQIPCFGSFCVLVRARVEKDGGERVIIRRHCFLCPIFRERQQAHGQRKRDEPLATTTPSQPCHFSRGKSAAKYALDCGRDQRSRCGRSFCIRAIGVGETAGMDGDDTSNWEGKKRSRVMGKLWRGKAGMRRASEHEDACLGVPLFTSLYLCSFSLYTLFFWAPAWRGPVTSWVRVGFCRAPHALDGTR